MAQARDFPEQAKADEEGVLARLQGEGVLDDEAVQRLRRVRGRSPIALVDAVTQLGLLAERELARHLGRMLGLTVAGPERLPAEAVEIGRVSPQFLRERRAVPLVVTGDALHLAVVDPFDRTAADGLRLAVAKAGGAQQGGQLDFVRPVQVQLGGLRPDPDMDRDLPPLQGRPRRATFRAARRPRPPIQHPALPPPRRRSGARRPATPPLPARHRRSHLPDRGARHGPAGEPRR